LVPRPIFLSNRNLEPHYGVDCVLRAFALIQQRIPGAALTVVGNGSQRPALEKLKNELGLKNTLFTGQIEHDQINQQYSNADVFLNGSRIDNQPLSILEAFACGLPVLTTDAGGIPFVVTDGETGFVVPVDDYAALADRAFKLLSESGTAARIARQARAECTKYTWKVVCDQWLQLYRELAEA
jgi:L-malate glycosyltransferase